MENIVTNYPNIEHNELNIFNNYRLYLQVHSLADITTGDGARITGNALQRIRDPDRKSNLTWPAQKRPSGKYWKIWRKMLRQVFTNNTYWSLGRPLGSWTDISHQTYKWFCTDDYETLYFKHSPNSFRVYTRLDGPRLRRPTKYQFSTWTNKISQYFEKTTIRRTQNGRIRAEGSAPIVPHDDNQTSDTFLSYIQSQPQWINEMLKTHELPQDLTPIKNALRDGTLEAVADGSYKKSYGMATAAWIITAPNSTSECIGALQVPGSPDILESYRAEINGILAIIVFIDLLSRYYKIDDGHITIACDNIEAGKNTLQNTSKHGPKVKHFDLLWLAWNRRRNSKIHWTYRHVKGHQERTNSILDKWGTRNIRMDDIAKRYMRHIRNDPNHIQHTCRFTDQWEVICQVTKITGRLRKTLIELIHGRALKHHFVRSGKISAQAIEMINWSAIEKANKKL